MVCQTFVVGVDVIHREARVTLPRWVFVRGVARSHCRICVMEGESRSRRIEFRPLWRLEP